MNEKVVETQNQDALHNYKLTYVKIKVCNPQRNKTSIVTP